MKSKGHDINIVFMGTPEFATASLKALLEAGFNVCGVVTAPDKPSGRGLKIQESDVKKYALKNGLKILQPTNLKESAFLRELEGLKANLFVVVAFRMLPESIWSMPAFGTVNVHASLLPNYRGAAPINHAIINGETESGVTTFFIEKDIDTGKIIGQKKTTIEKDENAGGLHDKLMNLGAELIVETVKNIENGTIKIIDQADIKMEAIKPAPKIFKTNCRINWNKESGKVYNHIRGLSPYPASWTKMKSKSKDKTIPIKIYQAKNIESDDSSHPGEIRTDGKSFLEIECKTGSIKIIELQQAGKKRMRIEEFLRGQQNFTSEEILFI